MKQRSVLISLFLVSVCTVLPVFGLETFIEGDSIITEELDQVIGSEIQGSSDPLRDGSFIIGENTEGIYNQQQSDTETTWNTMIRYISGYLNYALYILGLVVLGYMIYHGFLTLTAGDDEERLNKGREGLKYGTIVLLGIGLAWFVVSGLFWLITILTDL